MNSQEKEFRYFKQDSAISAPNCRDLKSVDHFTYLGINITSTESDFNICIGKALAAICIIDHWEI